MIDLEGEIAAVRVVLADEDGNPDISSIRATLSRKQTELGRLQALMVR